MTRKAGRCYMGHLVEGANAKINKASGQIKCAECDRAGQRQRYHVKRNREIAALKKRIRTLEQIVTDAGLSLPS